MKPASVAIIGGGVIGASVAYHLANSGWRDVVVLDRSDGPGKGSTGAATGGFRAQFATPIDIRLSLLSREKLLRFRDETGVDPEFAPVGYLWLATNESEMDTLRRALLVQHAEGATESREVGVEEIARLNPALRPDDLVGGAFSPADGSIRPLRILEGYLAPAERLGVRIEWGTAARGFVSGVDGKIDAVRTDRGDLPVEHVVNAAGPWAALVAKEAGVEIPVVPLRRQVAVTQPFDRLSPEIPMTLFVGDGFHLRVRDGRVLLLRPTPGVPGDPFDTRVDPDWIDETLTIARRRVPVLEEARIDRDASYAGLYEMSPDRHAILGPAPDVENFYLANGSSGHGVMHAPALGQLLAEILSDGAASSLDVTPLRPARFEAGSPEASFDLL